MDFPPSATSSPGISEGAGKDWVTFAWAFLKVRGANDNVNIGQQLRLQLWRPRRSSRVGLRDLHSWWRSGSRTKYPSTLHVTLKEEVIPLNPSPALRSAAPLLLHQPYRINRCISSDLYQQVTAMC